MSMLLLFFLVNLIITVNSLPINQLADRLVNASNEYKNNDIWWRGLDIINSKPLYPTIKIFTSGDYRENISCFRIPSLVNNGNKVMAFTEARLNNCSDCSQKGIVYKSSHDGGINWDDWQWIVYPNVTAANPTSIYDSLNDKIVLHYSTGKTNISGRIDCVPSEDNWQLETNDWGKTWSVPYNISKYLEKYRGLLPGPGNGVQISKRYVFPGHFETAERNNGMVISYYSDDFGRTWNISNGIKKQDEATLAKIDDTLVMNMRNGHNNNTCKCRSLSRSFDYGQTWGPIEFDKELKDPICQGTSTNINNTYFFLNPSMYYSRSNLTIHYKKKYNDIWKTIRITDEFSYSGYTGLTNTLVTINNTEYLGVLWTGCQLSLPFRVWCSLDSKWELLYTLVPFNIFH